MMCSSLIANDMFKQALFDGRGHVPSIPIIQAYIEQAWAKGFDCEGARQLGYSVVGSTKWIGNSSNDCHLYMQTYGTTIAKDSFHRKRKEQQALITRFILSRINGVCCFVALIWYQVNSCGFSQAHGRR